MEPAFEWPQHARAGAEELQDLLPPQVLRDAAGDGSFREIGHRLAVLCRDLAGLGPTGWILDVGCGAGRVALPLTGYLLPEGAYRGFDVTSQSIDWCRSNIGARWPQFEFECVDVRNGVYNPQGAVPASKYTFPYGTATFDAVLLASVFTHLLPDEAVRYLGEVARVLKPGGRCLATWFLLNEESNRLIEAGLSRIPLVHSLGAVRVADSRRPQAAVGHREEAVWATYSACDLQIDPPIRYGLWCGRSSFFDGHDIVVATRR